MDSEKVRQVCASYEQLLQERVPMPLTAERLPEGYSDCTLHTIPTLARFKHLLFMAQEIPKLMDAGRVEKAMRWLGWLQGALWAAGMETLEEAKLRNAPEGATYSRDA